MAVKKRKNTKYYAKTKVSKGTSAQRGTLVLLAVFLSLVALFGVYQVLTFTGSLFLSRNPFFELKNIEIRSDGRLSSSRLAEYAKLKVGGNIFAIDFDELRSNLKAVPLVESVRIRRKLPDTLVVDVVERVAAAQIQWKWRAVPFLVDRNGIVLPTTRSGQALPLIKGIKLDQLRPGEQIADAGVRYALDILSACDDLGLSSQLSFKQFDLRYPDYINATLTDGISARFPRHSASNKVVRLAATLQVARERGLRVKTVDLVPEGLNTPVVEY